MEVISIELIYLVTQIMIIEHVKSIIMCMYVKFGFSHQKFKI